MDGDLGTRRVGGEPALAGQWGSAAMRLLAVAAALASSFGLALAGKPWLAVVVYALAAVVLWHASATSGAPWLSFPQLDRLRLNPLSVALASALALAAYVSARWPAPQQLVGALWLTAMVVAVTAPRPTPPAAAEAGRTGLTRVDFAVVVAIGLVALLLRVWRLDLYPNGLHGDEGQFGLDSWAILQGKGPNFFDVGHWNHPGSGFHLYALWQTILGYGQVSLRVTDAINGTALVVLVFFLGRQMFSRRAGAIAALLVCCNASELHFSRIAISISALPTLWAASFLALWYGLTRGSGRSLALSGILGGLGLYTTFPALTWLPVMAAFSFGATVLTRKLRVLLRPAVLVALGFAAAVAPLADTYREVWAHSESRLLAIDPRLMQEIAGTTALLPAHWVNLQRNLYGFFVAVYNDGFYLPGLPMLGAWEGALFGLGGVYAGLRLRDLRYLLLLSWLLLTFFFNGVLTGSSPQAHRLWHSVPPALLLAAAAIDASLLSWRPGATKSALRYGLAAVAVVLVTTSAYSGVRAFFTHGERWFMWENPTSEARYIQQLNGRYAIGALGGPAVYLEHPNIRFLNPGLVGKEVQKLPEDLEALRALGKPIAFLVYPHRRDDLAQIRAAFPGGTQRDIVLPVPKPHVVFTVYCTEGDPPPLEMPPPDPVLPALLR